MHARRIMGLVALSFALTGLGGVNAVAAQAGGGDPDPDPDRVTVQECIEAGGQPVFDTEVDTGICVGGDLNGELLTVPSGISR